LILQIAAAVAAAGFIVLVYFLIGLIRDVRAALPPMRKSLESIEQDVGELSREALELARQGKGIAGDVQQKLHSADGLFRAVGNIGASVQEVAGSIRQVSAAVTETVRQAQDASGRNTGRIREMLQWTTAGLQLLEQWQANRKERETHEGKKPSVRGDD
jgi:uncharacterized protein YoxC